MPTEVRYRYATKAELASRADPGPDEMWFTIVESPDGNYWYADTGNTLHLIETCGALWCSRNLIKDPTRTMAYRLLRGDEIITPSFSHLTWLCNSCSSAIRWQARLSGDLLDVLA